MIPSRILDVVRADPSKLAMMCFGEGFNVAEFWRRLAIQNTLTEREYSQFFIAWLDTYEADCKQEALKEHGIDPDA